MHWRTCEVRQHKNTLAHLGSAPMSSQFGLGALFWLLGCVLGLMTKSDGSNLN